MENSPCIFCSVASGEIKSHVVYEDEFIMAVLDISPATKGHTIIMPKEHYNSLYEIPMQRYIAILSTSRAIAYALNLSMGCTTVDMVYTQELIKGKLTPHALIHAIPRYSDDTVNYIWQPNPLQEEDAEQLAAAIRGAFENIKNEMTPVPIEAPKQQPTPQPEQKKEEEKPVELRKKVVVF
jgi:histidine triad (HIT) family protein